MFREKGMQGEREGEKHRSFDSCTSCNPGMCPDGESNRWVTFCIVGRCPTHRATPVGAIPLMIPLNRSLENQQGFILLSLSCSFCRETNTIPDWGEGCHFSPSPRAKSQTTLREDKAWLRNLLHAHEVFVPEA